MDIKDNNYNYSSFLKLILFLCGFFFNHAVSYLYTILHAILTVWNNLLQLANFHLSFKTQIRFTPILELTTPSSVLPSYSLYITVVL